MVGYDPSERSVGEVIVRKREEHDVCFIFMAAYLRRGCIFLGSRLCVLHRSSKPVMLFKREEKTETQELVNFSSALTTVPPTNIYTSNSSPNLMAAGFSKIHDRIVFKCYQLNALLFLKEENLRKSFTNIFPYTHPWLSQIAFFAASKTFHRRAILSSAAVEYTTSPPRLNTIKPPIINPSPFKLFSAFSPRSS